MAWRRIPATRTSAGSAGIAQQPWCCVTPHLLQWHGTLPAMAWLIACNGWAHCLQWHGTLPAMVWHIACNGMAHCLQWYGSLPAMDGLTACNGWAHCMQWMGSLPAMDGHIAASGPLFPSIGDPTKTGSAYFPQDGHSSQIVSEFADATSDMTSNTETK